MCSSKNKYCANYNNDRKVISFPMVEAFDRSCKAIPLRRTVAQLIRYEIPSKRGFIPETIGQVSMLWRDDTL